MSGGKPKRPRSKTMRGYARSGKDRTPVGAPKDAGALLPKAKRDEEAKQPFVRVEYFYETGRGSQRLREAWWMYEMMTLHRVYCLDEHLRCLHVCERADRSLLPDHSLVGARLLGGKLEAESGEVGELSHPLPRRGASAVFERSVGKRVALSETSPVEEILLRLRVVDVNGKAGARVWRQVTGQREAKQRGE